MTPVAGVEVNYLNIFSLLADIKIDPLKIKFSFYLVILIVELFKIFVIGSVYYFD